MAMQNADFDFRQEITSNVIDIGLDKVNFCSEIKYYQEILDAIKATQSKSNGYEFNDFDLDCVALIASNIS